MRHNTEFRADQSNCCQDMVIFQFFKMAVVGHFGFLSFEILTADMHKISDSQYASLC